MAMSTRGSAKPEPLRVWTNYQQSDLEASLGLYRQAEQLMVDDAACIPLAFGRNYVLIKPYVKGYELNPLGFAMLNEVSIEPH